MVTGTVRKMRAELGDVVQYYLPLGDEEVHINPFLGRHLRLSYTGNIACKNCGRPTKKSFSQGYCYPCMRRLAACDMCIMKPETCHYHEGTCREPEWGERNCFQPHFVYLSNTSGLKVGITRHNQIPTRWIDQGATQAIPMFRVSSRRQSGILEMAFKSMIADKTNWRAMLKGNSSARHMDDEASSLVSQLDKGLDERMEQFDDGPVERLENADTVEINYPVEQFPEKVVSHNFDKNPVVEGQLNGIKGQYLLFDTGVINMRKFSSYEVTVDGDQA